MIVMPASSLPGAAMLVLLSCLGVCAAAEPSISASGPSTSAPATSTAAPASERRPADVRGADATASTTAPASTIAPASTRSPAQASGADTAGPRWDYLPVVGYIGDTLWFSLRVAGPAAAWSVHSSLGPLPLEVGDDHCTVNVHLLVPADGPHVTWIDFSGPGCHRHVRLLEPGHGSLLHLDAWQHLGAEGDSVVLVVDRTEPDRDRRWRPVRMYEVNQPIPCTLTLPVPVVSDGASGILADVAASQGQQVEDRNVLVMVPASDQSAGWKHREYRQVLAWLVSDLLQRRAAHVVLAEPIGPHALASSLKPIITEVHDVADAYHCRILSMSSLGDDQYWQISPGILGTSLNAGGREALDRVLAPWH